MAEPTQFTFDLREVAELLVKQQGIHDGLWLVGFEFGFGVGNFGPNPAQSKPSAMVQITRVLLSKHEGEGAPPDLGYLIDAAKVNPK
jgi:hypothetical protein